MTFKPGFSINEAGSLIALLAHLEVPPPPPLVAPPIPQHWKLIYDSPGLGAFDNKWQLYQYSDHRVNQYAVLIRGTVYTASSILDDLVAVMIPASGSITVDFQKLSYRLAADGLAGVHLGFALAAFILLFDPVSGILVQLAERVPAASEVFIAGHSQGAAIATVVRSYFNYSSFQEKMNYEYKTYLFAQPKPGNDHYGNDYDFVANQGGFGFTVANTLDWVPQLPLTLETHRDMNEPNLLGESMAFHPVLGILFGGISHLLAHAADAQLAKHAPQEKALAQALRAQNLKEATPASLEHDISILHSLNFANSGSPHTLQGVAGTNPREPGDAFWQHRVTMYYYLLTGMAIPA